MAQSFAEQIKRMSGNGAKVVTCVRCHTDIPEYAGRPVALISGQYAHHPGKCPDTAEREARVRQVAAQTSFAFECARVEPGSTEPDICSLAGMDRGAYVEHMRAEHGKTVLKPAVAPIRLRRGVPAAKRQAPAVEHPFKRITWATTEHFPTGEHGEHGEPLYEAITSEHRGQFWANGPDAHSVIVIEDRRPAGRPNQLVTLYLRADGSLTADWSGAKYDRREANRSSKRAAEHAGRAA